MRRNELFDKVRCLLGGEYDLPNRGPGAPGMLLETMLGVSSNPDDIADTGAWEIKYHGGSSLLTMFHKTPQPDGIIKELIDAHGWIGRDGRRAFRHTLSGGPSKRGFAAVSNGEHLSVCHNSGGPAPYWTHDEIMNAASKMRRAVVVVGKKKIDGGRAKVAFNSALALDEFKITQFIPAVLSGKIKIDFDARYQNGARDAGAIRDHGTKFRIKMSDLNIIYGRISDI